uniref:Uncharacterized protein n=1 Tax=Caenorhabditis tropicalis TaxID=1561998 RepID=A0A1I7UB48_9PELO
MTDEFTLALSGDAAFRQEKTGEREKREMYLYYVLLHLLLLFLRNMKLLLPPKRIRLFDRLVIPIVGRKKKRKRDEENYKKMMKAGRFKISLASNGTVFNRGKNGIRREGIPI